VSQSAKPVLLIRFRIDRTCARGQCWCEPDKIRRTYTALKRQLVSIQKYPMLRAVNAPAKLCREERGRLVLAAGREEVKALLTSAHAAMTDDRT